MRDQARVLCVSRNTLLAQAAGLALEGRAAICCVGHAATEVSELKRAAAHLPDAVVYFVDEATEEVRRWIRSIHIAIPSGGVIVVGLLREEQGVLEAVEAGAAGYLCRTASLSKLVATIEAVCDGKALCSPPAAAVILRRIRQLRCGPVYSLPLGATLTQRETEVLELIERGQANKQIARYLGISRATVKNHIHNILEKLHVPSRRAAVRCAMTSDVIRWGESSHVA